jgi:hypothetical protein
LSPNTFKNLKTFSSTLKCKKHEKRVFPKTRKTRFWALFITEKSALKKQGQSHFFFTLKKNTFFEKKLIFFFSIKVWKNFSTFRPKRRILTFDRSETVSGGGPRGTFRGVHERFDKDFGICQSSLQILVYLLQTFWSLAKDFERHFKSPRYIRYITHHFRTQLSEFSKNLRTRKSTPNLAYFDSKSDQLFESAFTLSKTIIIFNKILRIWLVTSSTLTKLVKLKSKTLGTSLISGTQLTHKEVDKPDLSNIFFRSPSVARTPQSFFLTKKKIKNKKIKK